MPPTIKANARPVGHETATSLGVEELFTFATLHAATPEMGAERLRAFGKLPDEGQARFWQAVRDRAELRGRGEREQVVGPRGSRA